MSTRQSGLAPFGRRSDKNVVDCKIDRFVYYNYGAGRPAREKVPGWTGGLHIDTSGDYLSYLNGIKHYLIMELANNNVPENALEELIEALMFKRYFPDYYSPMLHCKRGGNE